MIDKTPLFDADKVRADLEAVCAKKVNHFIYYKGNKHIANIPIYPKALKLEAIISRVKSLYPDDNVMFDGIRYQLATPIARFDNAVIDQNNGIDFQFELKQIENEFQNSQFNLVVFSSKYIGHLAYAFIGHSEPIFDCMLKKDVRRIAETYMDDVQYKQWFGVKFSVV